MWKFWNQPSTSNDSLLDFENHGRVDPQNVDNSNSEIGTQNNICGNNKTVSVSSNRVKTSGLDVQVSDPVASFFGRRDVLRRLHWTLRQPAGGARRRLVVLCGPGGIGKTQCARAYIRQYRAAYTNVVWLHCEREHDIQASFRYLYAQMNLPADSTPHDVYGHLNASTTLFVLDNAQDMSSISRYLPRKDSKCLFLITSQVKNWSPHESLELDKLDEACAMQVLNAVLSEHNISVDVPRLRQLAQRLDRIPLVLQISAGFICQQVLDFRSMDVPYNIDEIFSELEKDYLVITSNFPDFFDCNDYLKSVYVSVIHTMQRVWFQKSPVARLAADVLGLAAYLNPDELYSDDFKYLMKMHDDNTFTRAWAVLLNYSLVQKCSSDHFTLHRSVQQCLQIYFIENNITNHYKIVLNLLLKNYDKGHYHFPIILNHGLKYYEVVLNFYMQYSIRNTFQALAYFGSNELLKLLVRDLNLINNFEFIYLAAMAWPFNPDIMQILKDNEVDLNAADEVGNVFHHLCSSSGFGFSSLFYACCTFIKMEVNPRTLNSNGETAIDVARRNGHSALAELLESMTPNNIAQLAAKHNLFGCLHYLFRHNICKGNEQDEMGNTVLHALCDSNTNLNLFTIISRYRRLGEIDLKAKNNEGYTAARQASRRKYAELEDLLNPDSTGPRDLYVAAKHGELKVLWALRMISEEYVTYQDVLGKTPLHVLCELGSSNDKVTDVDIEDEDIIKVISESQFHKCLFIQDYEGLIPFQRAECSERIQLAKWLESQTHYIVHITISYTMVYFFFYSFLLATQIAARNPSVP